MHELAQFGRRYDSRLAHRRETLSETTTREDADIGQTGDHQQPVAGLGARVPG